MKHRPDVQPLGDARDANGESFRGTQVPLSGVVLGGSQNGKTEYALEVFLHQVLVRGEGGIFIDPSYRAVAKAKPFLTALGNRERVREITVRPQQPQISYNPLSMVGRTRADIPPVLDAFVDLFTVLQGWDGKANQRAINVTSQAVEVLLELNLRLPAAAQATVFQIPKLLTDQFWRNNLLPAVPERLRSFWRGEFEVIGKDATPPVTHLLRYVAGNPALRALLGASEANFSFRQAMDEKLIVLAHIGEPGERQRFLANLLLHDMVHAFFSRGDDGGPTFCYVLDELQTYDGSAGASVADALEGTAKFGGRGYALTQNFLRLSRDTQIALLTNRRLLISFNLEPQAAERVSKGWTRGPSPAVLSALAPHEAIVDCAVEDERHQFKIRTRPVGRVFADYYDPAGLPALDKLIASRGRPAEEVSQELETLDARILEHITRLHVAGEAAAEHSDEQELEPPRPGQPPDLEVIDGC